MSKKLFSEPIFKDFPQSTRGFYGKIFYMMMLNDLAVRKGLFDVRLSETNDPFTWFRFVEQINDIKEALGLDDDLGLYGLPEEKF